MGSNLTGVQIYVDPSQDQELLDDLKKKLNGETVGNYRIAIRKGNGLGHCELGSRVDVAISGFTYGFAERGDSEACILPLGDRPEETILKTIANHQS